MFKILTSLIFLAFTIACNAANLPDFPFVVSTGMAKQDVKPDIATININLLAFDKESIKALQSANIASKGVIDLLKKYSINVKQLEAGDIQKSTTRHRDKDYNTSGILGYEVSRNMTLKLVELSYYSELMNDLISINNVSGMQTQFDVSSRKEIESKLIQTASQDAKDKATKMALGLGTKIHSVYAISQASNFDDFFATFGASSHSERALYAMRSRMTNIALFIPESINISQHINVVFRIK